MMLQHPTAIYLLAALTIPLIIHLLNRGELGVTEFAALRWLSASKHHHWRRLVIRDLLLLLLRVLIFTLVVFWLANPFLVLKDEQHGIHYRLIHPSLTEADLSTLPENIQGADNIVYLQNDFPSSNNDAIGKEQNIWALLSEFDKTLQPDDSLQIIVPAQISIAGNRPLLTHQFSWHVITDKKVADKNQNQSVENIEWLPQEVIFISEINRTKDQQYLTQLFNSWSNYFNINIKITEFTDRKILAAGNRTLLINLSKPLSDKEREFYHQPNIILLEEFSGSLIENNISILTKGGITLYQGVVEQTTDDSDGRLLWYTDKLTAIIREKPATAGRWLMIYSRLSTTSLPMIANDVFSRQLLNLLQPEIKSIVYQQKVDASYSQPSLLNKNINKDANNEASETLQSLRNLLLLCVLFIFFIERIVSELRRQDAY